MAGTPTAALLRKLQGTNHPEHGALADRELLRRFVEHRDEAAFAALVRRYAPMVLGVGLRSLRHRQDAEDVCQATFLTLARKATTIRWRDSVAGWLYDVARRHACNAWAAANRRAAHKPPAGRPEPDAADEVTLRELRAALDEELARLPEKYRTPLVLCCLEGMTRDEAAQCLGLSVAAVKSRLEEGRERLRRRLDRRGLTLSAALGSYTLLSDSAARAACIAEAVRAATTAVGSSSPQHIPDAVASLVNTGVPATARKTLGVLLTGALAAGLLAAGLAATVPADDPPAPLPSANRKDAPQPRLDQHGDSLPEGAVLRLGTTRLRHANLFSLAFTTDGKLVSFGRDYVVKVWNPATGQLLRERAFEKDPIHRHQWGGRLSPDGTRLAVQLNEAVKVFDVGSGKELAAVKLASHWEVTGGFSPDGKYLAVADQDRSANASRLQLCDIVANTCRELAPIKGYSSDPVFSRDGTRIALAEGSAGVGVWDVATGRELLRFKPEGLYGFSLDFDATGDVLAVLGATNPPQQFHYVQISTGKPPEDWKTPAVINFGWVRFSPDSKSILFGGREALVCYDAKTGKQVFDADGWAATPPAFSPDGKLVASGRQNSVRLWDIASGRSAMPEKLKDAPDEEIAGVSVSPDGKWLLTKSYDAGLIQLWDTNGRPRGIIKSNRAGGRYPLFSPDGKHLFGMPADAVALVRWEFPGGKEVSRYTFAEPAADQVYVYHFGLSADGTRLAAVTQTTNRPPKPGAGGGPWGREVATFTLWDVATAKRLESRELLDSPSFMGYGAFAPDLRRYYHGDRAFALGGGADFTLDLPAGSFAQQGAASADGRLVAQLVGMRGKGDLDYRVVVHETATGKQVLELSTGYTGPIAFTPDGRGLLVTNTDSITRWDLATHKPVVRHKSPGRFSGSYGGSFASSLAVTRDGTRAVTGQGDTTALVWDVTPPARTPTQLGERELAAAWDDLGGADAAKAFAAIWALADAGADAVPFVATRLKPAVAPAEDRMTKLVAQLGAEEFADREAAERELRDLGDAAAPALREAAKVGLLAEQARRVNKLLTAADAVLLAPGDRLRAVRAVAVLEHIGAKDAREFLGRLAKGAAGARLTREAADALRRLGD
jgi:RNA polymerase sigma factor (sigma-70 family)